MEIKGACHRDRPRLLRAYQALSPLPLSRSNHGSLLLANEINASCFCSSDRHDVSEYKKESEIRDRFPNQRGIRLKWGLCNSCEWCFTVQLT